MIRQIAIHNYTCPYPLLAAGIVPQTLKSPLSLNYVQDFYICYIQMAFFGLITHFIQNNLSSECSEEENKIY